MKEKRLFSHRIFGIADKIARERLIMLVTSETGRKEREQMLGIYRNGEIRAWVSC